MEISDIKLDFLYLSKGPRIGLRDPFWKKWKKEKWKFYDFIEQESLESVVELTLHVFKDKYPRIYFSFVDAEIKLKDIKYIKDKEGYDVLVEKYIKRNDLKSVKTKYGEITEYESSILLGMGYEFKQPIFNITDIVEGQLKNKQYQKNLKGELTVYEIKDSPILRITVSANTFLIEINRNKWEFREP